MGRQMTDGERELWHEMQSDAVHHCEHGVFVDARDCAGCGWREADEIDRKLVSAEDRIDALKAELAAERERVERLREDAERYRWMRDKYEWRRHGGLPEEDSYAFVGCRFPYLANFECKAMLDYNIDQMRKALADTQDMTLDDHTRMAFGEEE